jgi:hypothetical protein
MAFKLLQVIEDYLSLPPDQAHNPQQMCRYHKRRGSDGKGAFSEL